MGCFSSSVRRHAGEITERARRKSSVWSENILSGPMLTPEDWAQVLVVSNLIRSQGIDSDIMSLTFERLFSKYSKVRTIFIDAGIITQTDDTKFDPRLRSHMREIALAVNKILELKTSDPDALEPYLRELRSLHRRIRGFNTNYYEVFAHCFEHAFLHLVGSAVSKQQKEAYRKFIIYLYKSMSRDDSSDPTDKDFGRSMDHSKQWEGEDGRRDRSSTKQSVETELRYSGNHLYPRAGAGHKMSNKLSSSTTASPGI
ncbi:hypothetical protein BsWGS_17675 [Bradybaena similaris]